MGIAHNPSNATIKSISIKMNELSVPKIGEASMSFRKMNKNTNIILRISKGMYVFVVNNIFSCLFDDL